MQFFIAPARDAGGDRWSRLARKGGSLILVVRPDPPKPCLAGEESPSPVFFFLLFFLWTPQESWIPGASNDESMMNHESVGFLFVYFTHKNDFPFLVWSSETWDGTWRRKSDLRIKRTTSLVLDMGWWKPNRVSVGLSPPPEGIRYQPELGRFFQPRYCRLCLDFSPLARVLASI